MTSDLKQDLVNSLKQVGAYDARVADPAVGFEHALERQHPLELWRECKSVVVFAVAFPPRTNNTYLGPYAPWQGARNIGGVPSTIQSDKYAMHRLGCLFVASVRLRGMEYLQAKGFNFSCLQPQLKLSAFDPAKSYPQSWSREKCLSKWTEILENGLYCHNCFAVCPAGRLTDRELLDTIEAVSIVDHDIPFRLDT